jgi:hypothetical protein
MGPLMHHWQSALGIAVVLGTSTAHAQLALMDIPPEPEPTLEVYGYAMLDLGYDFGQLGDPRWQDVVRPTKLPSFSDQFGKDGRWFEGARQSRLGVAWALPTDHGDVYTKLEFDMFGVGVDAGQTTFRLRHAYGEWHGLRAGQTWSPFVDPDVLPETNEYWGPSGMANFRNAQLAFMLYRDGDSDVTLAVERPGWTNDAAETAERVDLPGTIARFPVPDVSADVKIAESWGHIRIAGIVRYIAWDDRPLSEIVEGHTWGWGANVSSRIDLAPVKLKLQAVYGKAIESYLSDAGLDVVPKFADPAVMTRTIEGAGLSVLGLSGFVEMKWSDYLSSTAGYSFVWIDNTAGQLPDAFHIGHYALGNLHIHPSEWIVFGPEFQYGRRTNHSDGFSANDYRIQLSFQYRFDHKLGR